MEKLKYDIDNNGFYAIRNAEVISHCTDDETLKKTIKFSDDTGVYYFKSEGESGDIVKKTRIPEEYLRFYNPDYSNVLARNDFYLLSELYFSKLLPKFGIKSAEYHLAKMDQSYGVVSKDLNSVVGPTKGMYKDVLSFNYILTGRGDLKYITNKIDYNFTYLSTFNDS